MLGIKRNHGTSTKQTAYGMRCLLLWKSGGELLMGQGPLPRYTGVLERTRRLLALPHQLDNTVSTNDRTELSPTLPLLQIGGAR